MRVVQKIPELTGECTPLTDSMKQTRLRGVSKLKHKGHSLQFNPSEDAQIFSLSLLNQQVGSVSGPSPVKWPSPDPVARAMLNTMSSGMQYESLSIRSTAAVLGLQVRTLQRHLRGWGTTFERLLDDLRRERAFSLLKSGKYTITGTALLVGYSDAAHFTRAFHRWTGMSPRTYAKTQGKEKPSNTESQCRGGNMLNTPR